MEKANAFNQSKIFPVIIIGLSVILAGLVFFRFYQQKNSRGQTANVTRPVPVESAAVKKGPIQQKRTFTGTLEANAQIIVAPKVSGRVEKFNVNLADRVTKGQIVAVLDDDEYIQAVVQAKADLAVADANLKQAEALLIISKRELARTKKLLDRKIGSEADYDSARADYQVKKTQLEITRAQTIRAESALETTRIRLSYTQIKADWQGENSQRIVAERYLDAGQMVSANTPLLKIIEQNPIKAVFFVTERDYAHLSPGQVASLTTDVYPGIRFSGSIQRISPIFRESTRQARVELSAENPEMRLKPGMFIRITVVLKRVKNAIIIPEQAIAVRDGQKGVFEVIPEDMTVKWRAIRTGISQDGNIEIISPPLSGQVVTLGQQLLDDNSRIMFQNGQREGKP